MDPKSHDLPGRMRRPPARTSQDLIVWQKAHAFVLGVYKLTRGFPREEVYGLASQFRRAAVSIPANIAEGFKKRGQADTARFLNIAQGSLEECRYYLVVPEKHDFLIGVGVMPAGLRCQSPS